MSAGAAIVRALSKFGYPCKPDRHKDDGKKYFTYNYADERGEDYGDNRPGCIKASMQVHFFLPLDENCIKEKKKIREALFEAGFTYPTVTVLQEKEFNIRHIVFECDMAEEREE